MPDEVPDKVSRGLVARLVNNLMTRLIWKLNDNVMEKNDNATEQMSRSEANFLTGKVAANSTYRVVRKMVGTMTKIVPKITIEALNEILSERLGKGLVWELAK